MYDKKNGNQVPLFKFDMNFKDLDNDTNYILRVPGGFSGDPSKCLVGLDESFLYPNITVPQSNWSGILSRGAKWIVDNNPKIGRLANVYVSIEHILDVLNNIPKEKDGSITLLSFLKEIINTIQSCLGNINSIVIKEDPHEGTIRFIENAPQAIFDTPKIDENGDPLSLVRFNLYGVKPGAAKAEGSFVRNLSLEAEISNNLTTMIIAGAQINSNQLTVNATAFSQYNDGLKDRVLTERTNWNYTPPSSSVDYSNEKITQLWNEKINPSNTGLFQSVYGDKLSWSSENLTSLKELNTQFLQLSVGNLTERKQISTPFFMPFKLGFDMDGMSGIRLWEKFLIDDTILPPAYGEDNIDLQVTAINHVINNASWITHIDAIPAPRINTPEAIKRPPIQKSTVTQQQPSNQSLKPVSPSQAIEKEYLPAWENANNNGNFGIKLGRGLKFLMAAQVQFEGYIPPNPNLSKFKNGSVSYRSKNPGNVGTDTSVNPPKIKYYNTLEEGIQAQWNRVLKGALKIGGATSSFYTPDMSLFQYVSKYAPVLNDQGRKSGNDPVAYTNFIIRFFSKQGISIDYKTTLKQISNIK